MIAGAVFNAQQIDGIPALEQERTYNWDPIEQAEKAGAGLGDLGSDRSHWALAKVSNESREPLAQIVLVSPGPFELLH